MRRICLLILGLLMLFNMGFANSTTLSELCIEGKVYVDPSTVHIAHNGIFLNLDDSFIAVSAVCMDEHGIYVVMGYDCVRMVKCPKCGNMYDADNQSSVCNNGNHGWKCQYSS
jgi:hypothetical protein